MARARLHFAAAGHEWEWMLHLYSDRFNTEDISSLFSDALQERLPSARVDNRGSRIEITFRVDHLPHTEETVAAVKAALAGPEAEWLEQPYTLADEDIKVHPLVPLR